jgi:hypothetical protein
MKIELPTCFQPNQHIVMYKIDQTVCNHKEISVCCIHVIFNEVFSETNITIVYNMHPVHLD